MDKFIPNTFIYDRFLLKEELSYDSVTGLRTWAVRDEQTKQSYIVYFHTDGRTEWFADNRQNKGNGAYRNEISRDQVSLPPKKASHASDSGKPIILVLATLLVLSALGTGYYYRENISSIVSSPSDPKVRNTPILENQKVIESFPEESADSTAVVVENEAQNEPDKDDKPDKTQVPVVPETKKDSKPKKSSKKISPYFQRDPELNQ